MTAAGSGSLDELLAELEGIAEERRLPVVSNLLPGADADQLTQARDLVNGDLPDDVERLYLWHRGVEGYRNDASFFPGFFGGPGLPYVGITELAESLKVLGRLLAGPSYGVEHFQSGDIPLFESQFELIVFRVSTGQVHVFDMEEPGSLVLPSLSDLLRLVVRLWRTDAFWVDRDEDISFLESTHALVGPEIQHYRARS